MLLMINFITAISQEREIFGQVTSNDDGLGIPGVTIFDVNTQKGVVTDLDGKYTINVNPDAVLSFSYVGMITQKVPVKDRTVIDIIMEKDIYGLDEVVVVGYGTQRKSDLTGSVVSVKSEEINAIPTTNVAEMIRGKASGVEVSLGSARPGGTSSILIRGRNSLSGGNSPLFIVDGVPVDDIDDLNSRDIQSIEILKDASAQAIYGARASNGVILVSTRRGTPEKITVTYDGYAALQTVSKNFEIRDAEDWLEFRRQGFRSDFAINFPYLDTVADWADLFPNENILDEIMLRSYENKEFIDWEDLVLKNAWMYQHDLSIRGGTETTAISTSFGYFYQDGIRPESGFERGSFRLNLDQKITKKFSIGANTYFARSKQQQEADADYFDYIQLPPLAEPWDENGELRLYVTMDDRHRNPLFNNQESERDIARNRLLFTVFADLEIIPGLNYRLNTNIQYLSENDYSYLSTRHEKGLQYATAGGNGGQASIQNLNRTEYLLENILTYTKDFSLDQHFDITLMQGINERKYERLETVTQNFNTDILGYNGIGDGTVVLAPERSASRRRMVSYMGRLRYGLFNRYLFTLTGRVDGSSVFGPDNKYGFFPSAAFAWKIHEESFMSNIPYISNMKLRLSYGSIGNEAINPYQTQALTEALGYTFGNGETMIGYLPDAQNFPNYELRWETSTTFNTGIDFGFLKERIQGTFEYYVTRTSDLLVDKQIPSATGYTRMMTNLGKTENRGIEANLSAFILSNRNFSWSINLVFSRNRNKILEIDGTKDSEGNPVNSEADNWFIGYPINVYYNYVFDGIWQRNEDHSLMPQARAGDVKLKDLNNDGQITAEADRNIIIRDPDWYGSFGTSLRYKGIDLIADFNMVKGVVRQNQFLYNGEMGAFNPIYNSIKMPYWTPENKINTHPRAYFNGTQSQYKNTLGYQDASYFRLRTLTLSYTFPRNILDPIHISKIRVYARGTNLFTFTDYLSYTPEASPSGYPEGRIYTLGMNISF